jgi:hypothetical protein
MRQRVMKKLLDRSRTIDRRVFRALMISQVWFSVAVVEITLAHSITAKILVGVVGVMLTVLVLVFMKTRRSPGSEDSGNKN